MSQSFRNRSTYLIVFAFLVVLLYIFVLRRLGEEKPKRSHFLNFLSTSTSATGAPKTTTATSTTQYPFNVAGRGFWEGLGATRGHIFDEPLAVELVRFFKAEQVETLLELGAGMGTYAKFLRESGGFHVSCYDGNPQTQELSLGRCAVIDLSKPIDFDKHDWTLSLEVGEHIPREMESTFLSNLNGGTRQGVILSWGIEGQTGTGHVNNRNNSYIRGKFQDMGYKSDPVVEDDLRYAAKYAWFDTTIMVFRRNCGKGKKAIDEGRQKTKTSNNMRNSNGIDLPSWKVTGY